MTTRGRSGGFGLIRNWRPVPGEQLFEAIDLVVGDDVGEGGGGATEPNGRASRSAVHSRPILFLPLPGSSNGTGALSARNAKPARTWRSILSLKGQAVRRDDHFAMTGRNRRLAAVDVDVGMTMQQNFDKTTWASGAGPGRPFLIGSVGIGALARDDPWLGNSPSAARA